MILPFEGKERHSAPETQRRTYERKGIPAGKTERFAPRHLEIGAAQGTGLVKDEAEESGQ